MADLSSLLGNVFNVNQPDYINSLLGSDASEQLKQRANTTGLINMAVGYLAQPKNQRLGLGRILANSYMAGQQGAQGVYGQAIDDYQMKAKIDEMQRQKDQRDAQQSFLKNYGQPNAVRDVISQESMQVPVAPVEGAVAPNFDTQQQAPVVNQEQYFDPNVSLQQAISSGVLPFDKALELMSKQKAGSSLLNNDQAAQLGLPTNRGQVYQKDLTTGKVDIVTGTLKPDEKTFKVGDIQEFQQGNQKITREYQPDGTWKNIATGSAYKPEAANGDNSVDFLNKDAQSMAAALYLKTGTLPPLGSGKNASLAKANILNIAALMNQGKTPQEAADSVFTNKQNRAAEQQTLKTFTGGIEGRTKRAMNVATDHLFTLEEAGIALKNGDIRLFNAVGNKINKEFGVAAPTSFDAVKKIVAGEIVKATTGSAGALGDRKEVEASIMSKNSPEQLLESINYYKQLMAGQLNGLELQWETGTNRSKSEFRQGLTKKTLTLLPPIESAKTQQKAVNVQVPAGINVDPVTWNNMTESERKLFLPKTPVNK